MTYTPKECHIYGNDITLTSRNRHIYENPPLVDLNNIDIGTKNVNNWIYFALHRWRVNYYHDKWKYRLVGYPENHVDIEHWEIQYEPMDRDFDFVSYQACDQYIGSDLNSLLHFARRNRTQLYKKPKACANVALIYSEFWCLCSICTEKTNRRAACGHFVHQACIDKWVKYGSVCPMCQA